MVICEPRVQRREGNERRETLGYELETTGNPNGVALVAGFVRIRAFFGTPRSLTTSATAAIVRSTVKEILNGVARWGNAPGTLSENTLNAQLQKLRVAFLA